MNEDNLDQWETMVRQSRQHLRESDDGPPVDFEALHLYIDKRLDPESSGLIRKRIVTWRDWNQAYWEAVMDLSIVDQEFADETIRSGPNKLNKPPLMDQQIDAFTLDDEDIRSLVRKQIAPYESGDRPIHELENKTVVDLAFREFFGDKIPDDTTCLRFYRVASTVVVEAIARFAKKRLGRMDEPSGETLTSAQETTFAISEAHPEKILRRLERLDELSQANEQLATEYSLYTFAGLGLDRIASLQNREEEQVVKDIEVATNDVCLDD